MPVVTEKTARLSKEQKYSHKISKISRPLIVSYSYSGNTHRIAHNIQKITGGDWCEIYPWQPYPMAFPELLEQVKREIQAHYRPRLLPVPHAPHDYSVIYVGTPNWCGRIAPPLASWLCTNDLSGKKILPFYSHCGGVAGDLRGEIIKLCPKADVREALGILNDGEKELAKMLRTWMIKTGIIEF